MFCTQMLYFQRKRRVCACVSVDTQAGIAGLWVETDEQFHLEMLRNAFQKYLTVLLSKVGINISRFVFRRSNYNTYAIKLNPKFFIQTCVNMFLLHALYQFIIQLSKHSNWGK